jgi:hypothetical protein
VRFFSHLLVVVDVRVGVGAVDLDEQLPGEHDQLVGKLKDLGDFLGVGEEPVCRVAAVGVASVLKVAIK